MPNFSSDDAQIIAQLDEQSAPRRGSWLPAVVAVAAVALLAAPIWVVASNRSGASPTTATVAAAPAAEAPHITWYFQMEQAQQLARAANKPILLYFYTDWCPACKSMDAQTMQLPSIRAEAQRMISLRINAEHQPQLAARYAVKSYPTVLWVNADGQEIGRRPSGASNREFWQEFKRIG